MSSTLNVQDIAWRRSQTEQTLLEAYRSLPVDLAREWRMKAVQVGSAIAALIGSLPNPLFNRVANLGVGEDAREEQVDELLALYGAEQLPFMVQLSPVARPTELPTWLEARGFENADPWAIFVRDLKAPPEHRTDLRVERIGAERAAPFAETFARGYGIPDDLQPAVKLVMSSTIGHSDWFYYLAFDGATPVAAASMCMHNRTARMAGAATLPEYRQRGAQAAFLACRIRDAAEAGCDLLTAETAVDSPEHPNPSYHNMLRSGFELAYLQQNYVRQLLAQGVSV